MGMADLLSWKIKSRPTLDEGAIMEMQTVESSLLYAVGYNPSTQTLRIQFLTKWKPGATYEYADVPREVWERLESAPSKGKYFLNFIKKQFTATRIS
jgi:KTSC domain-containing protein